MGTSDAWSCSGTYGKAKAQSGDYYVSPPVALHLFGTSAVGWSSKELVHAVEVDASTPPGPQP